MIRVRFAPSPTGRLHLGNIRTALFNYLFARAQGGTFILRLEDTDRERFLPEYREGIIQDMRWMGLNWDEGPENNGPYGPYEQSERLELYQKYANQLIAEGKAYYCYVTQEETDEAKRIARLNRMPPRFDNRGRNFTQEEIEARKARGIKPTLRFKVENPQVKIHDLVRGDVEFNLDDMSGDFVILRADGTPTFHLAVCVDDALMKVTHVIRGEDHLSNTPKHILLIKAMGFEPPQYGHLSLIHGPGGEPLSKRLSTVSVGEFRRQGYLPEALVNYIAFLGWSPGDNREIFSWEELQKVFSLERVNKSSSIYDPDKLNWVNGQHLRLLSDEVFTQKALDYLQMQNLLPVGADVVRRVLPAFKDAIAKFDELPAHLGFLKSPLTYENAAWLQTPAAKTLLTEALALLPSLNWNDPLVYDAFIAALKPKVTVKGKELFMPVRVALTGKEHGPELKKLFPLLGQQFAAERFKSALGN
ncbi:MAG TPA: glutamate--tRNA ligase [Candidatus Omnitrophota bacterium]|nr:glutamate--tRNA ligase [Candidatus Omnitrophota bacterium]